MNIKENWRVFIVTFKIHFFKIVVPLFLFLAMSVGNALAIENFELYQEKYVDSEHIMLYSHVPTGVKLVTIQPVSDQQHFSVEIAFKTPTCNNKGIAHVVEHCVLNGSKDYPIKNLPLRIKEVHPDCDIDGTTYHDFTRYIFKTSSKINFLPIFDIFWSSIFDPAFLGDKKIFQKESFFYDSVSHQFLCGSVLQEIIETYSVPERNIFRSINKQLFDSSFQYDCGGTPWNLLDLTYKEAVEFYKTHYSFSNMLVILRGSYNWNELFQYFDKEYFSKGIRQDNSNNVELQTVPSDGVPTKYFVSEYDSTIRREGERVNAFYFIKHENPEDFLGALVLDAMINSKSSNFKKLAKEKEYENLVFKVSGGYKKLFGFEYMKKSDLSFEFKKFETDLKEILKKFLETLTEEYIGCVCESIKGSLKKTYSNEKISALTLFNNFVYYNDPLRNIEYYSQNNIEKSLDKICNIFYLKGFIKDNIIDNDSYTIGVFLPKKNLNNSLIKNAIQKFGNFVEKNKITSDMIVKDEFEKWNCNKDEVFSIINSKMNEEKFINWRKYFK